MNTQMQLPEDKTDLDGRRFVDEPFIGYGRMLLAAQAIQPN